jgi:hypothetical protein
MSRKDGITKETSRTKMGMKDILQETEEQQWRWHGYVMRIKDCKLLDSLRNGTHRGKVTRQTSQCMEGWDKGQHDPQGWRIFLSRGLEGKNYIFELKKTVYSQKYSFNNNGKKQISVTYLLLV